VRIYFRSRTLMCSGAVGTPSQLYAAGAWPSLNAARSKASFLLDQQHPTPDCRVNDLRE
jgi:hypothetical protein